jgi:tripartite-type tricarboxylate transporter receptor subunit TctC
MSRRWLYLVVLLLAGVQAETRAQAWPTKPIRIIVPISAGSGTDVLARALADRLGGALGQILIIENRPGAGGAVGAIAVAKAAPDGYTLLVTSSALTVAPAIYANLAYDPLSDLAGVTPVANLGAAFIAAPSKSFKTVRELVALAKARPGQLSYGSSGTGSASHLTSEKFRLMAGFEAVHVPYRGAPEAVADAMTGRIDFVSSPLAAALPLIQDGKLVALAVPSPSRSALLPDVPTIEEAGVPNASSQTWVGVLAPKATPRDIVNRLQHEIVKVLQLPELKAQLHATGSEPLLMTPEEFDALMRQEVASNKVLANAAGIKVN